MNLRISLVVLSALAATAAYANRATDAVHGPGDHGYVLGRGSLSSDGSDNMFYNPAYVNDYKNWATIEKSNGATGAEGGFVASMMNFNLGLYMGRNVAGDMMRKGTSLGSAGYLAAGAPVRPFEVFLGTDLGSAKLGLSVSHGSNSAAPATGFNGGTSSDMNVNVGASVAGFEPFAGFKVQGKDPGQAGGTTAKHEYMRFGTRYKYGEWTPYAAIAIGKDKLNPGTTEFEETSWGLGLGRNAKIADGVTLHYSMSYWMGEDKNKITTTSKAKKSAIPLEVSAEGEITSWLTLHGGLQYALLDRTNGVSAGDNTTGRVGATIRSGKVSFDFAVGGQSAAGTAAAPAALGSIDSSSFDFSHGLFSNASLTYSW